LTLVLIAAFQKTYKKAPVIYQQIVCLLFICIFVCNNKCASKIKLVVAKIHFIDFCNTNVVGCKTGKKTYKHQSTF